MARSAESGMSDVVNNIQLLERPRTRHIYQQHAEEETFISIRMHCIWYTNCNFSVNARLTVDCLPSSASYECFFGYIPGAIRGYF